VLKKGYRPIQLGGAALLFVPWAASSLLAFSPFASWIIAWFGSIGIFLCVWTGRVGGVDTSAPWRFRILNPIYLMQAVFAGYGFMTSIFYWLDLNGFLFANASPLEGSLAPVAQAQRFYVLAHASLAMGLVLGSRSRCLNPIRWKYRGSIAGLLLSISAGAALAGVILGFAPGLAQFREAMSHLALVAGAMSVGPSLAGEGRRWLILSISVSGALMAAALASGWKEDVLVMILLIGAGTFPMFPKATVCIGATALISSLIFLPILSSVIRKETWGQGRDRWETLALALENVRAISPAELAESNRAFLTQRLSEIGMFVGYIDSVEGGTPREGSSILMQTLLSPVPRILWKDKPDLEVLVMQRTYSHGVVSENSSVSAKPHPVVDGYLLGGGLGICLTFTFIGIVASLAYSFCESNFGGLFLGGVFFNGLFSMLWRGNSFEFMFASFFWGMITAFGTAFLCRKLGWTIRPPVDSRHRRERSPIRPETRRNMPIG